MERFQAESSLRDAHKQRLYELRGLIQSNFVSTALSLNSFVLSFDRFQLNGLLDSIVAIAQAIDPKIKNIRSTTTGVILFEVEGVGMLPAHFMGEGVLRILSLLAQIVNLPPGSVCLIDEIDTGLHYTALFKMWNAVLEAAERHDIQVFVTTHSDECVRALVSVLEQRNQPLAEADCKLYRLEQQADRTRAYDYDMSLIQQSIQLNWGYR